MMPKGVEQIDLKALLVEREGIEVSDAARR
jgi:hypothetical protein